MANLEELTTVTLEDLATWYKLKKQLSQVKSAEALLRSRIFKHYFPDPKEGTNTYDINDGTGAQIKATHTINREVDQGELDAFREAMFEEGNNLPELALDKLIKWKPSLALAEYRSLSEAEQEVFDRILVVKPGSPQMDIKTPKAPK